MTENKDALLPCPFCGAVATVCIGRASDDSALAFVTCGTCGVNGMNFKNSYAPVSEAIAAWNTRAKPPARDAMREALEKIAADFEDFPKPEHVEKIGDAAWRAMAVEQQSIARAALSAPNVAGERPKPYTKLHHVLHAAGLYPTPQPESVEVKVEHDLIERLLDAQQDINLAANERMDQSLCDASALIDEIEPILRAALTAMPAETTQPGPGSWVPADQFVALRHERDGLRAALAEAIEALKQCHAQFDFYAFEHRQAEKFEKAETNQRFADMITQVVAKHGEGR